MGHNNRRWHASSVSLAVSLVFLFCLGRTEPLYHTSSEILHWFSHSAVKHPSLLRFEELKERHTHTYLPVATIGAAAAAAANDINTNKDSSKPVVLFVFGEHAREVITPEVAIWLARILTDNSSSIYTWPELAQALQRAQQPSSSSSSSSSDGSGGSNGVADWAGRVRGIVSDVLEKLEVQIVPIEALDSRRLVEEGELCVRKTSSNVDLNRNWPFAWHRGDPGDEQYGGSGPLSEPQSRLVKQLIDSSEDRLLGYVNVHSGEWALYTPWDSKPAYAPDLPADLPQLVSQIGRLCDCKAGPAGAVSGYLAFGSSMDYVYVHKKVPYPITVEVYGGGEVGKLQPGETNKPLTDFPVMEKHNQRSAADEGSPPLHRRGLTQQQQQQQRRQHEQQQQQRQHEHQHQQQQQQQQGMQEEKQQQQQQRPRDKQQRQRWDPVDSDGKQQCLKHEQQGVLSNVLSCVQRRLRLQSQQKQQQQQQQDMEGGEKVAKGLGITRHRLQHQQQVDAAGNSSMITDAGRAASATTQLPRTTTAGVVMGHGGHHSRRMALLQLTEQQQQQQAQAQDDILDLVMSSDAAKQACFDAFNPRTTEMYRRVVADWVAACILMLKHMVDSEAYKNMSAAAAADNRLIG